MADDASIHRPGEGTEESERNRGDDADRNDSDPTAGDERVTDPAAPVERGREEWNYRDWVLVGVVVLCFLVIPATILVLPPVRPFRFAYLVLPLIPAFLLGAVAVWSAQRST